MFYVAANVHVLAAWGGRLTDPTLESSRVSGGRTIFFFFFFLKLITYMEAPWGGLWYAAEFGRIQVRDR